MVPSNHSYRSSLVAFFLTAAWLLPSGAIADVRLPHVFSDHMVLQRGMPLPIWGWAEPGESVRVQLGDSQADTVTDPRGRWIVKLPDMERGRSLRTGRTWEEYAASQRSAGR